MFLHLPFQCVQYIDDEVLTELVPRLTELTKSGIGVGTKVSYMFKDRWIDDLHVYVLFNSI